MDGDTWLGAPLGANERFLKFLPPQVPNWGPKDGAEARIGKSFLNVI